MNRSAGEDATSTWDRLDYPDGSVAYERPARGAARTSGSIVPVRPVPYAIAKRALDIVGALLVLLVGLPVFAVCALLIKASSPGPVFFRQMRLGRGGRPFACWKFRTMYVDAEPRAAQLRTLNEASGPIFKIKADPRIHPVGRFLRKCGLDQMPMLLNVLRGDMSLVGPYPPLPREVERYTDRELRRLSVKPGLTCLWQVERQDWHFDRWIQLDLEYIETMSFALDLKILLKSILGGLPGRGAY